MILDRVTIDIDHYVPSFRLKALRAYYALQNLDVVDEIIVHVSSSGQGIHIEGHLSEILTDDERMQIRRTLNDDDKRCDLDEERGANDHAIDIYWTEKDGNEGERERVPDVWAALDRIEATRAPDQSRVKALALHGRRAVWDTHGINRASLAEGV